MITSGQLIICYVAAACFKKFPIKKTALWDLLLLFENKKVPTNVDNCFFFKGHHEHRSFSKPCVEPPSKPAMASKDPSSAGDAIEKETSEDVKKIDNPSKDGYICMI